MKSFPPPPWYKQPQSKRSVTLKIKCDMREWDDYILRRVVDGIRAAVNRPGSKI